MPESDVGVRFARRGHADTPVCKKRQNLVYGVARDEEAEISCEVEADPPELSFKWALNNSVETFDVKTFVVNGTVSVATYRPRWKHSYGLLYCWAANSIGTQREPCAFHIIPAGELVSWPQRLEANSSAKCRDTWVSHFFFVTTC